MIDHHIPNIVGRMPSLDDYEGDWDDVLGVERDDTLDDLDAIMEEGFSYGESEGGRWWDFGR
jgi:hypothetical protein